MSCAAVACALAVQTTQDVTLDLLCDQLLLAPPSVPGVFRHVDECCRWVRPLEIGQLFRPKLAWDPHDLNYNTLHQPNTFTKVHVYAEGKSLPSMIVQPHTWSCTWNGSRSTKAPPLEAPSAYAGKSFHDSASRSTVKECRT